MAAPKGVICQSCAMPMSEPRHFGTEADGKAAKEYCCYCYQKGAFTADLTREQMIDKLVDFAPKMGMTEAAARKMAANVIPKLKRWNMPR